MDWQKAIEKSRKGTAYRTEQRGPMTYTFIRYGDGSGMVCMGSALNTRLATQREMNGFTDWQPSE